MFSTQLSVSGTAQGVRWLWWYRLLSVTISKPEVGGKNEHERQKDEGWVRPRLHRSLNRHNTTV